jgi:hypothetical protein
MRGGDGTAHPKVVDFGLAAVLRTESYIARAASIHGSILGELVPAGSLACMSPEQLHVLDGGDPGRVGPSPTSMP